MSDVIIRVEHLSVQFGLHHVLRDLNFTVTRGETVAVIGESGCGKTVLLKTLLGLLSPTQGHVLYDGHNISTMREDELASLRIRFGFVFQQAALFDSMNILENLAFPMRQHTEKTDSEILMQITRLLGAVGLRENILMRKPAELSGGMRKRVGIARALALNPEMMLYDEPTTGLDPIMTDIINSLMLRTSHEYPVTSIIVTHDMTTVKKVADRVIMLYPLSRLPYNANQIVYDGSSEKITTCSNSRVRQFVQGNAKKRLREMGLI